MVGPLLATKLSPPQARRNLVARPRLVHRLDQGQQGSLILVSAPAGYGKTTLVSDWLRHLDRPSTWLSLDERDNDQFRFLSFLVSALQKIDPALGGSVVGLLQTMPPPPAGALASALVNEIVAVQRPFIFILDDYHLIDASAVHQLLAFVLDHFPPNLLLVILTRSDPPLPIPRLLVRNQCLEVRAGHIRFTQ